LIVSDTTKDVEDKRATVGLFVGVFPTIWVCGFLIHLGPRVVDNPNCPWWAIPYYASVIGISILAWTFFGAIVSKAYERWIE